MHFILHFIIHLKCNDLVTLISHVTSSHTPYLCYKKEPEPRNKTEKKFKEQSQVNYYLDDHHHHDQWDDLK